MAVNEKYLLTGAMGCIGAWVMRTLLDANCEFVATDLHIPSSTDDAMKSRPGLLLSRSELDAVQWVSLDVTDLNAVLRTVEEHQPTHIIHLAGLQIPFCRATPALGASVNVVGSINLFEAVRQHNIKGFAYASSLAVLGPPDQYSEFPIPDSAQQYPRTLYGVYKTANEEAARVYWADWQVGSVGLRPHTVYGVTRDQGMTADIAKALLATAAGEAFHIRFDGVITLQHASDVAKMFIQSAQACYQGAALCNIRNDVIEVAEFVGVLKGIYPEAKITFEKNAALPFPADLDDAGLRGILGEVPHTPLAQAIESDVEHYGRLLADGRLDLSQLV